MEEINFRILNIKDKDILDIRRIARSWDKKHYCFIPRESYDEPYLDDLFSIQVALFKSNELIGYGTIDFFPKIDGKSTASLAYIINPNYHNMGYGKKLVEYLILIARKKHASTIDFLRIEVLKKNSRGLAFAENLDFDFSYFDNKKIVFEKKI